MYFSKSLVIDIMKFAVLKGADAHDLSTNLAIDPDLPFDHNETISYSKMESVLNLAHEAINDEFLGLHMGEQLMLNATKKVDEIMQYSPSIEEAFINANNYSKMISDALIGSVEHNSKETKVVFDVNPNWIVFHTHAVKQIIDLTLVCTMKSIYWMTGQNCFPIEVQLPYASVKNKFEYYRIFDCRIKFDQANAAIVFPKQILNLKVSNKNLGLLAQLKKSADEEIEKIKLEEPLLLEIKKSILSALPKRLKVQKLALEFKMSSRTLQRKLRYLNTSYKKIEKDILISLSKKMLLFEHKTIEEISYLLGFSEASAFIRFFKTETKTSPKKFKELESDKHQ